MYNRLVNGTGWSSQLFLFVSHIFLFYFMLWWMQGFDEPLSAELSAVAAVVGLWSHMQRLAFNKLQARVASLESTAHEAA
ncbi:MAG: hypothetical protein AAGJ10_02130 [Bacteroidota bacterium]